MKTFPHVLAAFSSAFFCLGNPVSASAASVTWDGGTGGSDASGTWETGTNWSGDNVPGAADNAQLLNVTSGTRTVTVSSGSPQIINKLTVAQSTIGAFNVLQLNDNLTISGSSAPFAFTATAGQDSIITNIAAAKTLLATYNGGLNSPTYGGNLNLAAGSIFRVEALGASSDLVGMKFDGPINATGAGAKIVLQGGRFVQNPVFNGAVNVNTAGSTLTLNVLNALGATGSIGGSTTFNGNDGSGNSVKIGAGTQFNFDMIGSTFNFTNRVTLAAQSGSDAGGQMTFGALVGGSATTLANFNGGLAMGAGGQINVRGPSMTLTLAGSSTQGTGSAILLQTDNAQGNVTFANTGTLTSDGSSVTIDWASASSNNGIRRFMNSGTWTLKNAASMAFISTTGRPIGGFGLAANNNNSGTLNVESGSKVDFTSLFNTGTMNLGSSTAGVSDAMVALGSPNNTISTVSLINGLASDNTALAGTIHILGNATLGRSTLSDVTTFNNGVNLAGTVLSTGSTVNVGDGITPITFTLANSNVSITNSAGNNFNLKANTTMLVKSLIATNTAGYTRIVNNGTFTHSGTIQLQGAFNGARSITTNSGGTYVIGGTSAALVALPQLNSADPTNTSATVFSVGGLLVGSSANDKLAYTNSTGASSQNALNATLVGGQIAPGNGTAGSGTASIGKLELANINVTTSGAAKLSIDIGGDTASGLFDQISLTGTYGRVFTLAGTDDTLDIRIVNGFASLTPQTYLILTSTNASGRVGTFDTLLYNGIAVTDQYTVNYLANGIEITLAASVIPEPSGLALIGLGGIGLLLRRRLKFRQA